MMRKTTKVMMALLLSQSILANAATHPAGMSVLKTIWQYARLGDKVSLEQLKRQGVSLDSADAKGNTVLCASVLLNNKVAYNTLIAAGADADVSCMSEISKEQKAQFCLNKGLLNDALCATQDSGSGLIFDSIWAEVTGVALIGAAVAAVGGGGGGGGGSGDSTGASTGGTGNAGGSGSGSGNDNPNPTTPPDLTVPDGITSLPVAINGACSDGVIINGVCTKTITPDADGSTAISKTDETENPMKLAEFGGVVSNEQDIEVQGDQNAQKVVMHANGVAADAVSEDGTTVDLSKASSATNTSKITLTETAEDNKGVVAMKATAAGTIKNTGDIAINSVSNSESVAMLAEGKGASVENSGSISLTAAGKTDELSGIHAADRQVVNTGTVDIVLGAGTQNERDVATIQGLYGSDVYNNGTMTVQVQNQETAVIDDVTEEAPTVSKIDNPIRSNVYALTASPNGKATNNGTLNLDLTGMSHGVYGIFADASSGDGAKLTNNKDIKFTGQLENNIITGKQVIVMGSTGGAATATNKGNITVDVDASKGGYLSVMKGFSGTLTNEGTIDLTINSNGTEDTPFHVEGMAISNGSLVNKGKINAKLTGAAAHNSSFYAIYPTGGADAMVTNSGIIDIHSDMDNFSLVALASGLGLTQNDKNGKIYLTTSGENSNLYATFGVADGAKSEGASNQGHVVLTHNGGSGQIVGFAGGNDGILDIYANDMNADTEILGGSSLGGSTAPADGNQINITLTGKTFGNVMGYRYKPTADEGGTSWQEDNDITINAQSDTRNGKLTVTGFGVYGYKKDEAYPISFTKTDSIRLNVAGVKDQSLDVFGMKAKDGAMTLDKKALISINADLKDSQQYLIVGMNSEASEGLMIESQTPTEGTEGENGGEATGENPTPPTEKETFIRSVNKGTIEIKATGTQATTNRYGGNFGVIGMLTNSYAKNEGVINITTSGNIRAAGMLAYDGGIIENVGEISFTGNADNFVALYAGNDGVEHETGKKAVIYNSGTIKINNINDYDSYGGKGTCMLYGVTTEKAEGNWRDGGVEFERPVTQINNGVDYVSELNGEFVAQGTTLSGDVIAGTSLVQDSNQNLYVASGSGDGALVGDGDWSHLGLSSASAMFDATYAHNANNENGIDIVMTRRSFNEMTQNGTLADFLERNYMAGNNMSFYNELKSIASMQEFAGAMNSLTGHDTMINFAREDLTAMREINMQMNDVMFANTDKAMFSDAGTLNAFGFKNDDSSMAQYMLAGKRINSDLKIGYAMSVANLNSDNGHDTTRQNSLFQAFMPIGYAAGGWDVVATPQIGYARGHYSRKGFDDMSYNGVIEKRIFALMNEARYPVKMGAFEVSPTVEFNAIAYNTKGGEDKKAYALTMPSDNNLSVEAGVGLHTKYAMNNLYINAGLMMYREFADPYNIKLGMQGMDGTFNLYDENRQYRGVASFGFGYDMGNLNVFGSLQHFMETNAYTKLKTGLKYKF